ncbi:unnamed protein product [Rhodiola kirilowii]
MCKCFEKYLPDFDKSIFLADAYCTEYEGNAVLVMYLAAECGRCSV